MPERNRSGRRGRIPRARHDRRGAARRRLSRCWKQATAKPPPAFSTARDRIDILFTDIRLPGSLDGWEVARVARRARAALPVIYATGYTVDRMAEVPGAIFLHKPYQPSTIVETIRRLLR